MHPIQDIQTQIEALTEERVAVLRRLSQGHDPGLVAEHQRLDDEIARLWDEQRIAKARIRFGERDEIIRRARTEERLDRAA